MLSMFGIGKSTEQKKDEKENEEISRYLLTLKPEQKDAFHFLTDQRLMTSDKKLQKYDEQMFKNANSPTIDKALKNRRENELLILINRRQNRDVPTKDEEKNENKREDELDEQDRLDRIASRAESISYDQFYSDKAERKATEQRRKSLSKKVREVEEEREYINSLTPAKLIDYRTYQHYLKK
jgi:hypothetical protein